MYLLFDIGGTNMRFAVSRDLKQFGKPIVAPTPQDFGEAMRKIQGLIASFAETTFSATNAKQGFFRGGKIRAAAGGIAGVLDKKHSKLLESPNIAWLGKTVRRELQKIIQAPVYLENDADMAGLGEARYGAGKGYGIVAYITVGTGVGGTRVVNGQIDANACGFEPGHQIINFTARVKDGDVKKCRRCASLGHLEGYVSGSAFKKQYGKNPADVMDKKIWDRTAKILAYGLNNIIVHWSPDAVVLGGSMIVKRPGISVADVRKYVKQFVTIFPEAPKIKKAALGDFGGLYGAMAYLKIIIANSKKRGTYDAKRKTYCY